MPPTIDYGVIIDTVTKLGFAAAVAWYLLTTTTRALDALTKELSQLRGELTNTRSEMARQIADIRQEIREVRDALSRRAMTD